MAAIIERLWKDGLLPAHDGIYFADGRSFSIKLKCSERVQIDALDEFDLMSLDTDCVSHIDITRMELLQNGKHFCCGEGSSGADGFFALLNSEKKLLWAVFFDELNPFRNFFINGNIAIVKSTSNIQIRVDLEKPTALEIIS